MHTEEDTAPWWWDERAAVVDMAMPWMASSAMAREGASARGRRERVGTWNGGWERIRLDKDKERAAVFGWPG